LIFSKNYSIFPKINNNEHKEKIILETWTMPQDERNNEKKKKNLLNNKFLSFSVKQSFEKLNNFNTLNSFEKNNNNSCLIAKLKKNEELKEIVRDYEETHNRVDTGKISRASSKSKKMRVSKSNNIL